MEVLETNITVLTIIIIILKETKYFTLLIWLMALFGPLQNPSVETQFLM